MHARAPVIAAVLVGCTVWIATSARAAPRADPAKLYAEAVSHYKAGRFAPAATLFHRAFALRAEPVFLFNAARAEHKDGRLEVAAAHYRELLELPDIPDKMAARAGKLLARVDAELQARRLKEQREARARAAALHKRAERRRAAARKRVVYWAGLGTGLAVTGVGAWLLSSWAMAQTALDDKVATSGDAKVQPLSFQEYKAEQDRVDELGIFGASAIGAGVIAAGVGTWLLVRDEQDTATLLPTRGGMQLLVRF